MSMAAVCMSSVGVVMRVSGVGMHGLSVRRDAFGFNHGKLAPVCSETAAVMRLDAGEFG